ncbi:MAG: MBL fold metallo-hydrolase [Synechococcales bacterium]|nr:MBL fold metallo-hydrolase [Synechococcales bacterium]
MMTSSAAHSSSKSPRQVLETVFAFPPNRDTLGGTAYLILEEAGNILVDCPAWEAPTQDFLQQQGGVRWLFFTHRGGVGRVRQIQEALDCEVVIQEQEAYLLPGLAVTAFHATHHLSPLSHALWTPGHSPGSACLYHSKYGGVLFSGRHLLPNTQGQPTPLRVAKTFHWFRQLRSVQHLRDQFTPETLRYLCPGANTGFLRGQRIIDQAYDRLTQLDLEAQRAIAPAL